MNNAYIENCFIIMSELKIQYPDITYYNKFIDNIIHDMCNELFESKRGIIVYEHDGQPLMIKTVVVHSAGMVVLVVKDKNGTQYLKRLITTDYFL